MGLAVFHSDCFNGTDSIPVTPEGGAAIPVQLAQCVCADPDSKKVRPSHSLISPDALYD